MRKGESKKVKNGDVLFFSRGCGRVVTSYDIDKQESRDLYRHPFSGLSAQHYEIN
jgi:hypothetical protein